MKDITTEEAVKILKHWSVTISAWDIPDGNYRFQQAIEKVLNELDTLQNGFNTAGEHQTELIRENSHLRYELFNNQKELKEKDKIIDAMAEEIYFMVNMGEWIDNNNIKKLDYKEEVKQ